MKDHLDSICITIIAIKGTNWSWAAEQLAAQVAPRRYRRTKERKIEEMK